MTKYFNVLLIFAPVAILGEFVGWSPPGLESNDCLLEPALALIPPARRVAT